MLKFLSRHRHPAIVPLESDTRPIELASSKEKERVTLFQHDVAYKRLLHAVRELQGAVRQLEVGLSSIQAGQLEHQGGLVRTLATVEELSAATEEVAAAAQTSATVAEHADHLAEQGRDAVRQAHQKMDHIKKAVQETGATVKELGQKTTAITRIVDVIREIAAETNLLSLNASIEAARAGEAGRGFAVVAGEVRQLSEQSATQAKQIEGVIKEIGEEISLVIARMNDSLAAVADGANVVEQADVALAAIVDAAGQVNEMVRQISAAATQQATGSSEILEVVSEMATTSEQVSYAIDKAMMDAAQQHSALERLNSLTLHLGDISQNLGDRTPQTKPLQHYRWCIGGDALTFDPHLCNEMTTTLVLSQIFMGLTRFGTDTRIVPGLARAWDLSPDGRTWTFQLRRGARFHNGREIKAADVKYSLERILRPATKSPNTWLVEMIQGAAAVISGSTQQLTGVRTEGDYTVHITLEYPYHPILANLAYIGTSIVPREVAELGKLTTQPIGAGPFQLANYEQGKRILLKAHTDFYGGRPFLDELELVPKLAANSDLEALNSGEVNHLLYLGAQNMHAIESHPLYANRIQSTPVLRTNYLGINCGKSGPLQNALVRQALNYAIDKETMIRELFGGRARVASGPLPPGCEGFDESIRPYPFDPNRAKAKLAEAGYPQGLPQPLLLHVRAGHEVQRQQAEMVRGWLAQIGIRLETKEIPWSELVTGACMRQCDLFFLGWTGDTGDPDNFLQPLFNSTNHGDLGNRTFFTNAEVDAKLAAGQSIRDPERRRKHYQELQRLLHELAPWVFLSYEDQFLVTRPEVRGLNLHPLGMVYLENAWLDLTQSSC